MNFVGHIAVSDRLHPGDTLVHLGAALPDLASIGRFRLVAPSPAAHVQLGVDLHHRTDDAFHSHPGFVEHSSALRKRLEAAGLPRGASLAIGHVGVELLLDGHLLNDLPDLRPTATAALACAPTARASLAETVDETKRSEWARHLERVSRWPLPDDYHVPAAVAERLHRILRDRRRLAFDAGLVATVADALAPTSASVAEVAGSLLDDLCQELGSDGSAH